MFELETQLQITSSSYPIYVDGKKLEGELVVPETATQLVIFSHGSGSSRLSKRNLYMAEQLQKNNMLKSSYEQRLYLQNNYEKIVEEERKRAMATITPCYPCKAGELINEKNKELDNKYIVQCDGVSCYKTMINEKGLGTGNFF